MRDDTKPTRSSLSSRKEGTASPHWASGSWIGSPRYLGGLGQPPTRFLRGNGRQGSVLKILTSGPLSSSAPDCLLSPLKGYRASHGAVVLGSQLAILVERRAGTKGFNVRASLFVGPRLSVVFPQGVQGVPWRCRARLPASDPCGRTCRNFATCRTTSSRVPSRPDAGPMAPWQEVPQMLPPSVPLGFQGSQPPPR